MNILVTGCAGFIGSSLTDKLILDNENKIIGIDNFDLYYPRAVKENNIKNFINKDNFTFYEGDIRDKELLSNIFKRHNIDIVVHLAAKAGVRHSFEEPVEYVSVNIEGTVNILNTMQKYNVSKIVFASSSSVYGNCKEKMFSEDLKDLQPISPYAQSKKNCEDYLKLYTELFNINAVALRFFTVFGPRQRPDLAIHKFAVNIAQNKPIPFYGDGTTYRDYTYIEDITDGIISAMYYDKTKFEIFNLGSQNPITLTSLVEYIEKDLGKNAIIEKYPMQKGDVQSTYANISKAQKLLGYKPKLTFQEGLHKFIEQLF